MDESIQISCWYYQKFSYKNKHIHTIIAHTYIYIVLCLFTQPPSPHWSRSLLLYLYLSLLYQSCKYISFSNIHLILYVCIYIYLLFWLCINQDLSLCKLVICSRVSTPLYTLNICVSVVFDANCIVCVCIAYVISLICVCWFF